MSEPKKLTGAKAVITLGGKVIGEVKNIEWRKAGDPIPMDKVYVLGRRDPRLIINGEEVSWPPP